MNSFDRIYALFVALANIERVDDSGEPNTFSVAELQALGAEGLDLMDTGQGE